ncbi:MAG: hypothetical protein ACJ8R9_32530 [Steroidobacteraceae bacterium]
MPQSLHIVAAGNTLAPALAELVSLGFSVSRIAVSGPSEPFLRAEKLGLVLDASDPLELLGLAMLAERRGAAWVPSDDEVDALLKLQGAV